MNKENFKKYWLSEESKAHIFGWDFSHIEGRFTEEDLPWDYGQIVRSYLKRSYSLLDIDTGGGEFLLSLNHTFHKTSATESYPPNVKLCEEKLLPLGINFYKMSQYNKMPFDNNSFDIIINRHGNYDIAEIYRTLKPNGIFITEQVGKHNDRELIELLCPSSPKFFSKATLDIQLKLFSKHRFKILEGKETFKPIKFYDTGALVWFAKIIEWEFIDFSVEKCFNNLLNAEKLVQENGSVDGTVHRYLIVAQK